MDCDKCIVSVGRSGSKWIENVCQKLEIPTKSNRVDIGVRVELYLHILQMNCTKAKLYIEQRNSRTLLEPSV